VHRGHRPCEAHSPGPQFFYDWVKQQSYLQSDRPDALREALYSCRKGGTVFALGVFVGLIDKFPMGALMNKGLTLRGAQQHGERYMPMLLERMAAGELKTAHLMTHPMSLDEGAKGYDYFKNKIDGCVRARSSSPRATAAPKPAARDGHGKEVAVEHEETVRAASYGYRQMRRHEDDHNDAEDGSQDGRAER